MTEKPLRKRGQGSKRHKWRTRDKVSSEPDGTAILINIQQLWLPVQDLCKMEPVNILAWSEKGPMNPLLLGTVDT